MQLEQKPAGSRKQSTSVHPLLTPTPVGFCPG